MTKTHFKSNNFIGHASSCGRGERVSDDVSRVSCLNCKATPKFAEALADRIATQEAAFAAQEPRTIVPQFGRVNGQGVMDCYKCGGILFRERPRSLFSYHYVCANPDCGTSVHPMTETGMST